jgi:L-rhamnose mutarotase
VSRAHIPPGISCSAPRGGRFSGHSRSDSCLTLCRASLYGRLAMPHPGDAIERVSFVLRVRPDKMGEYRARHAAVWPEMREALREAGWRNYSLFLREDGLLVGYLECDDFAACQARMQATEVNARWQREMAPLFDLDGAAPDASMRALPEIFHLD